MNVDAMLQNLVFGLFIGSNYGVAAAGLSLVFGVLRVLNVAHGELLMLGGYTSFWLFNLFAVDPFISVLISAPLLLVFGLGLHRGLFVFVERLEEEDRIKNSLLVSFGLGLILQNLAQWLFTADERSVNTAYAGGSAIVLGLVFPYTRLASLAIGTLSIVALDHPPHVPDHVRVRGRAGWARGLTGEHWLEHRANARRGLDAQGFGGDRAGRHGQHFRCVRGRAAARCR